MQKYFILWVSLLTLIMGGCATKNYTHGEAKMVVIKTPKLKFADMGYIRYGEDAVQIEIFVAGVTVEKITIDSDVCVSAGCMSEERFVKEYLYDKYPKDTMRRILQNMDIFSGVGKSEMCNGAEYQYIRNEDMDIVYRRKSGEIYFKDRLNSIMIKISDVKETNATE